MQKYKRYIVKKEFKKNFVINVYCCKLMNGTFICDASTTRGMDVLFLSMVKGHSVDQI